MPDQIQRLNAIMARLRSPGGCPWDQEQSLESLRPFLLEETYEVLEAIDSGTVEDHREELGDLLLQIVFQARIREEEGAFSLEDVARGIADKMERRHPHVFGAARAESSEAVVDQWEAIKREEKGDRDSVLDGLPPGLPALARSQRLQEKAARVGFDWEDLSQVWAKVDEEIEEIHRARFAGDAEAVAREVGDLLFSVVNLARHLGANAEDSLRGAARRFERRFREVEARVSTRGEELSKVGLEQLDELWEEVKSEEE